MRIIWIDCPPGHKILFSDGVRRPWQGPVGSIESFPNRHRDRFERMCRLLDLFGISYRTNVPLPQARPEVE